MKIFRQSRGTTLILSLVILTVLNIVLGTLMQWQIAESRITKIATSRTQATVGSDALQDFGIAQVDEQLQDRAVLQEDEFLGSGGFNLPENNDILAMLGLTSSEASVTSKELEASKIPALSASYYIDPTDPANKMNPFKGKQVFSRYLMIFTKLGIDYASAKVPATNFLSTMLIDMQEDHLFSNAIFSDTDLVVLKPPEFKINGPVHTNGFLVLVPSPEAPNKAIEFDGIVTVVKNITFPPEGSGHDVNFKSDDASGFASMNQDYTGSSQSWIEHAESTWHGWLQTGVMGVKERAPIGFSKATSEENKFRGLIEPAIPVSENPNKVIESQKMATKAGVVIEIEFTLSNPSYNDGEGTAHFPSKSSLSTEEPSTYQSPAYNSVANAAAAQTAYNTNQSSDKNTIKYKVYKYAGGGSQAIYRQEGGDIKTRGKQTINNFPDINNIVLTKYSGNPIKMWDARRRLWVHLIDIDIAALKQAIDGGTFPSSIPWNGIIYVHVKGKQGSDFVNIEDLAELDPHRRIGIRLINAKELPQRNALPGQKGFTLATNVPLYVKGSFNANGTLTANSSTTKDSGHPEIPAALMADAITLLSDNWDDTLSRGDVRRGTGADEQYSDRAVPGADVEISAGLLTGYGVFLGGGVNNLIRYLEMWDGRTLAIRGSLAALFRSDIAYEPFQDYMVYYPPDRKFGMHDFFNHPTSPEFPPGDPLLRTWKKSYRQDVSEAEYNELKTLLQGTSYTSTQFIDKVDEIRKKYRDLGQ